MVGSCVDAMKDERKTKKQLIEELDDLRGKVAGVGVSGVELESLREAIAQTFDSEVGT